MNYIPVSKVSTSLVITFENIRISFNIANDSRKFILKVMSGGIKLIAKGREQ